MTDPLPELKPCFFCNHEDPKTINIVKEERYKPPLYYIECSHCCYQSSSNFKSESNIIEAHNFIAEAIEQKIRRRMDRND